MDIEQLQPLATGPRGMVCVVPELADVFQAVVEGRHDAGERQANGVRRVLAVMRAACDNGFELLNPEKQLKFEARLSDGGTPPRDVALFAFKADQFRAYGGDMARGARRTFVVTGVDESKKDNKAKRSRLRAAAQGLGECIRASEASGFASGTVWTPKKGGEKR